MAAKSLLLEPEVAVDGIVRIPKTIFTTLPAQPASASEKEHVVVRLDGTKDVVKTGVTPNNPAFAPRQAWPGGKILTNDKLEVQLKFYERKGLPLTEELLAKKAELEQRKSGNIWERLGSKKAKATSGGGRVIKLGGMEGPVPSEYKTTANAATFTSSCSTSEVVPTPRPPKPKGGVKVEGGLVGDKRCAHSTDATDVSRQRVV